MDLSCSDRYFSSCVADGCDNESEMRQMDIIMLNTIVGIVRSVVGIIGIIIGIIGGISLHSAKFLTNIKAYDSSNVKYINYNGMKFSDMVASINEYMKPYGSSINSIKELEKMLKQNSKYFIPIIWQGTQGEFDKINNEHKIHNGVLYLVVE